MLFRFKIYPNTKIICSTIKTNIYIIVEKKISLKKNSCPLTMLEFRYQLGDFVKILWSYGLNKIRYLICGLIDVPLNNWQDNLCLFIYIFIKRNLFLFHLFSFLNLSEKIKQWKLIKLSLTFSHLMNEI